MGVVGELAGKTQLMVGLQNCEPELLPKHPVLLAQTNAEWKAEAPLVTSAQDLRGCRVTDPGALLTHFQPRLMWKLGFSEQEWPGILALA